MATFSGLRTGSTHGFTVLKLEDLEITVKDELGHPLAWWYLVELPSGEKKKGRLDANGHAKLERVPKGRCNVKVTQDEPADPPPPPPPPTVAPPTTTRPPPGESDASRARTRTLADGLGPIRGNDVEPDAAHPDEPAPHEEPARSGPQLTQPNFDAAKRFRFHEKVLRSREILHLLWGHRSQTARRHQDKWITQGVVHADACPEDCAGDRHLGRGVVNVATCSWERIAAASAPSIENVHLEEKSGGEAEAILRDMRAHHYETYCNFGVALCYGEAYGGPHLQRPGGAHELSAYGMVRHWRTSHDWHTLTAAEWQDVRDIAECGGFVWSGWPEGVQHGHVWSIVSSAENGLSAEAGSLGQLPIFHVGAGKPHRRHIYDRSQSQMIFFVPKATWDEWQSFKSQNGDVAAEKQRARQAVQAARGG